MQLMGLPHSPPEGKVGKTLEDTSMCAAYVDLANCPSNSRATKNTMLT